MNNKKEARPRERCIHLLFEEQVEQTPGSIAVIFGEQHLTYRELNARANQLAHYLFKLGVGPEVIVGICVERSLQMIIGLIGILKAGAAYLPLDPVYPEESLSFMLEDAQASVLLKQNSRKRTLESHHARPIVLESEWLKIANESDQNLATSCTSANLAYVIYTSGSTGRPKGVAIEHRSAVALLDWSRQVFAPADVAGMLASTSICFDLSVFEMFAPLTCGGKIILSENVLQLPTLPAANQVCIVNTGPSGITELLRTKGLPSSVTTINLAGEPLASSLVDKVYEQTNAKRVFDLYGPTEDTTFSTFALRQPYGLQTIGRPITNTRVYILDNQMRLVPDGSVGELYLAGAGLARGYLRRAEITAEKFVPDPFSGEPGARLYKTGDLARCLEDGNLEFLGRLDHQVKVRGLRIELGEIESVLAQHPKVEQAVVMAREDVPGDKRLVAYIVPNSTRGSAEKDLLRLDIEKPSMSEPNGHSSGLAVRDFLPALRSLVKQKLPEYMLPSAYIFLDAFPLTINGKIDRKALPAPTHIRPEVEAAYVAPRTETEERIAAIWRDVLKLDEVGIHDNFLELGGHSMLASQIVSRIREAYETEFSMRSVLEFATVAELAAGIETKTHVQQEQIATLQPVPRESPIPLSFAQQRLWFLDQLVPGTPVYNMPTAVRLLSALNVAALERSLNEIVRRHEVLRTTISGDGGQPIQVIAPELKLALPVRDLRSLPGKQRESEISRLAKEEAEEPFDLARGPLVRTSLLWVDQEEYVLLLTMHHLVFDNWSMLVFFEELSALYEAYSGGRPSPLPKLLIQYADYAAWQRGALHGAVLDTQLAYWKGQLAGAPTVFELPADRPRPPMVSFRGARQSLTLSNSLVKALRALSQSEGATTFMTLLAVFYVLLYRLTGQEDILVGSPIANRTLRGTEGLIGLFLNNLVLRARLSNESSFRALLKQVRWVALQAYSHQDVPFERLVEVLQPQRDLSRTPLFQVFFNFFDSPDNRIKLCGVPVEILSQEEAWSQFDLTLYAAEQDETIQLELAYNADLFEPERMAEMLDQFRHLLEQVVGDRDKQISAYSLVTSKSRIRLPDPTVTLPQPHCEPITRTISSIAKERPDHPAICKYPESWSYRELSDQAEQIAQALLSDGLKKGDVVAVGGPPSFGLIVGMLGVLNSGGVLLTLDRSLPSERQRLMIREAGARRLLCVGEWNGEGEWLRRTPSLVVKIIGESDGRLIEQEEFPAPQKELPIIDQDDAAYLFFTSGTTGIPKGVLGCHKGLSHFLQWQRERFEITPSDRCAQLTGLSFDVVLRDIFLPLSSGASLHLPDSAGDTPSSPIVDWLAREQISVLHTVPSLAEMWLSEAPGISLGSLRYAFFAGEPLTDSLVRRWRNVFPSSIVVNLYGPTETTLAKCCYVVPNDPPFGVQPIGQSLPEAQALVLNRSNGICGIGEPGEIVIRTPFRTLGYINAAEEQRARFIKNPFGDVENDLVYCTGDHGRYRPDGQLEILGRLDDQIKIRGLRIEPGEVNAILASHPSVAACVVVAVKDEHGENGLAAYVVSSNQPPLIVSEIRAHLERQLPAAMQPTYLICLNELPLTPNGKVDRKALPPPDRSRKELAARYVAPGNPTEEIVASIWSEVLGAECVGVFDNFFELGGHSLKATRVISRINSVFQIEVPLRTVFEARTVAGLAAAIEERLINELEPMTEGDAHRRSRSSMVIPGKDNHTESESGLSAAKRALLEQLLRGRAGADTIRTHIPRRQQDNLVPLSFAQQRLWFLDQLEPNNPFYNVSQAIRLRGLLDTRALAQTIDTIISRHESLRTTFKAIDGSPMQIIADSVAIELPIRDLNHLPESERETEARRLATEEARRPFDLAEGPLMRASLVRLAEDDHVLSLTMHHIISDGWSLSILTRELGTLYQAYSAGQPSPLPELLIQYADHAVWQREWLQGEVLAKQLSYWREQLAGAPAALELPTDRPRPPVQTFRGADHLVTVPRDLTEQLKALAQREGVTLYMLLLAAFQVLLSRYSGQEDIVVGSPIAGRNRAEIEGVIGFFVNMLVMRTSLSGDPSFRELLKRVREVSLGAYEHQDLPFEKLVEELQPERSLGRSPLFQVMFAFGNVPEAGLKIPGLTWSVMEIERRTSKSDLAFFMGLENETLYYSVEYSTDLFEASTITRLAAHFQTLLEGIIVNPEGCLSELPLLTAAERQELLVEWNDTRTDYPRERTINQLFEAQVERTPDAVALVFRNERLSYRELNERANQLAHHLQKIGVGPEVLVAISVRRSVEMVIGLLGILKAGGAYVPLDPDYPQERVSFMLADSRAPVLITQEQLLESLPESDAQVVCVDRDWAAIASESRANPECAVRAENLAYVIYTSGSTGRPKGVAIEHHSTVALLEWTKAVFTAEDLGGVLASTSICFDLSVFELFVTLTRGGKVILALDALRLIELAAAQEVRLINTVPSAISELVRVGGIPSSVRTVNLAGEPLAQGLVEQLYEQEGVERVFDLYGPSEDTTYSTYALRRPGGVATIGRPISNTEVYILDEQQRAVPVGVPGEIYIGGAGLARGYLNRPELTSEKFISNPFSADPVARLYRTGDLVRYLADGNLEFLGRIDHQVKLRGYRIELGEIESVLAEHPAVREVVVVAREETGEKRLVAYLVVGEGLAPGVNELRSYLKEKLPDYMVPSAFMVIDELPLTPNGKVDRRRLPAPEQSRPELKERFVAPRDELESRLTRLWEEILGVKPIQVTDNFFELGGHSLLAVRLFAKIEKSFNKRIPLAVLFRGPTIENLANLLRADISSSSWSSLVPIKPDGSKPPLYLVHPWGGNVLCYRTLAHLLGPDQPVYGIQPQGLDGKQPPHLRIEDMAAHYITEISRLQPAGPYYIGGLSSGGTIAFEMAQQLQARGQKVALLVLFDTFAGFRHESTGKTLLQRLKSFPYLVRADIHFGNLLQYGPRYLLGRAKRLKKITKKGTRRLANKFQIWERSPLQQTLAKVQEANLQALKGYVPRVYSGRITLFITGESSLRTYQDGRLGWNELASEGLELHLVPGDHLSMIEDAPHAAIVAEKLRTCLSRAQASNGAGS